MNLPDSEADPQVEPELVESPDPPVRSGKNVKLKGSLYLMGANTLALVIQFLAVPLYIDWLGKPAYSGFLYVTVIYNFAIILSPNVLAGAQKRMTEHMHDGNMPKVWEVQKTQLYICWCAVAVGFVALMALGSVMPLTGVTDRTAILLMFLGAGIAYAGNLTNAAMTSVLAAAEEFRALAVRTSVEKIISAMVGLAFAYAFRSPAALWLGTALGSVGGTFWNYVTIRKTFAEFTLRPHLDRPIARDLLVLFAKSYPHRVANGLAASADRFAIPFAGGPTSVLADYSNAYRVPELSNNLLIPIADTTVPEMTRQVKTGGPALSRTLDRVGILSLFIGACFILVPSAFGYPLLKVWLGHRMPLHGELVLFCVGLYFCLQYYFNLLAKAFYAKGELQHTAPLSIFNAASTAILTIPAYRWQGLVGVGAMKAAISVVQFVPWVLVVRRVAAHDLDVPKHLSKAAIVLALSGGVALVGYWLTAVGPLRSHVFLGLLVAPIFVAIPFLVLPKIGVVDLPEAIARRLPRALR